MRVLPGLALPEGTVPSFADAPFDPSPDLRPETAQVTPVGASGEEAPGKRSLLRAGMSVVWMILLAAGYLWKSCTG